MIFNSKQNQRIMLERVETLCAITRIQGSVVFVQPCDEIVKRQSNLSNLFRLYSVGHFTFLLFQIIIN